MRIIWVAFKNDNVLIRDFDLIYLQLGVSINTA